LAAPAAGVTRHELHLRATELNQRERLIQAREGMQVRDCVFLQGNDGNRPVCVPRYVLFAHPDSFLGGVARGLLPGDIEVPAGACVSVDWPTHALSIVVGHVQDGKPYTQDELKRTEGLRDFLALTVRVEKRFEDGRVYEGDFLGEHPDGRGKMTWPSGASYDGMWQHGHRHGQGTFTAPSGTRYEGAWRQDMAHGWGTQIWANGDCYEGMWHEDAPHGQGIYVWPSGHRYEGEWRHHLLHGQGTYTWSEGHVYTGAWNNDVRSGHGKMTYANGDCYEGMWHEDRRHGWGKMIYANGDVYEGAWRQGEKDAHGATAPSRTG
jgi:hypothetical protein